MVGERTDHVHHLLFDVVSADVYYLNRLPVEVPHHVDGVLKEDSVLGSKRCCERGRALSKPAVE
eukprot:7593214-Prorocentrum_lima.AAC.1